jgi:hypothetical protein
VFLAAVRYGSQDEPQRFRHDKRRSYLERAVVQSAVSTRVGLALHPHGTTNDIPEQWHHLSIPQHCGGGGRWDGVGWWERSTQAQGKHKRNASTLEGLQQRSVQTNPSQ